MGVGARGAFYLYAAGLLLLATHIFFGTVWLAFQQLKRGKLLQAEVLLNQIKRPQWLLKGHRAYYHFTKGMVLLKNKKLPAAQPHLEEALQLGLRTSMDKALAHLNLAHIYYVETKLTQAEKHLEAVKAIPINDLMIKQHVEQLERALPEAKSRMN